MSRMSAQLVVSLIDGVSGPAANARRSLTALERAERDVAMARRGDRLSRTQVAEERLLAAQDAEREKRLARARRIGTVAGAAIVAGGYAAIRAARSYAQLERTIGRIVINADKPAEAIKPTITMLQQVADAAKMPLDDVVSGLETLIASGRSLEEGLGFLATVARTAQASGAEISDIALTADSVAGSMGVVADRMQAAFDLLAAGGKAGKFELVDMAKELPALLPAFAALGYEGEDGLKKIVAMLQIVRNQTGSSAEAATNLGNVFQKVYSRETAKAFSKMGIDLPAALDKAREEGRDIIDELIAQTSKALDGDLSKLPLLFTDAQVQKGMRALLTQTGDLKKLMEELGNVSGTVARDFAQITGDSEAKWQTLANNVDKVVKSLGNMTGQALNPALDAVANRLSEMEAVDAGRSRLEESGRDPDQYYEQFVNEWLKSNPDAGFFDRRTKPEQAFRAALAALGRGEISNIFDPLRTAERTRRTAKEYGRAAYVPGRGAAGGLPEAMDAPETRSNEPRTAMQRMVDGYRAAGDRSYGAGVSDGEAARRRLSQEYLDEAAQIGATETLVVDGTEAGSQIAGGVSQGGSQAAGEIGAAIRSAGSDVARMLREAVATMSAGLRAGSVASTGQAVRVESQGQAVDFGGRRR